jgi:hypothetical protein
MLVAGFFYENYKWFNLFFSLVMPSSSILGECVVLLLIQMEHLVLN